jgi:hypothetical protein
VRTLLICHGDAPLHEDGMARWLASWSTLAGVIVIDEAPTTLWRRVKREMRRVGALRFLDVLAFRVHYRLTRGSRDAAWARERLARLRSRFAPVPTDTPVLHVSSPNSVEAERFASECNPDLALALCKTILAQRIFTIPRHGTWVLHPGICPEYRNAHGCFWALAHDDLERVGMTLLRIDAGVDTGPVYGYFTAPYDELAESHVVIQHRVVLDNLDGIRDALERAARGELAPIDTIGRRSAAWGQPWLTSYLSWRKRARRRRRAASRAPVS